MKRFCIFLIVAGSQLVMCRPLPAQSGFFPIGTASPQAKSEDELDDYGHVFESETPKETISLAKQFLKDHPASEFRLFAIILEMHACEALDDYEGLLSTGGEALKISSRNIDVLITLANAMADRLPPSTQEREKSLTGAEAYAREAQSEIEKLVRPFSVPRSQFGKEKRDMEALIAAALGLVALQRRDSAGAITEYERATVLASAPRGIDYYRLGIAYLLSHQYARGLEKLQRAVTLGPPLITNLAEEQINELRKAHRIPD